MMILGDTTEPSFWGEVFPYWLAGVGAVFSAVGTIAVALWAVNGDEWKKFFGPTLIFKPLRDFAPHGTPGKERVWYHLAVHAESKMAGFGSQKALNCYVELERLQKKSHNSVEFEEKYFPVKPKFAWSPFPLKPDEIAIKSDAPAQLDFGFIDVTNDPVRFTPALSRWMPDEIQQYGAVAQGEAVRYFLRIYADNAYAANFAVEVSWPRSWDGTFENLGSCVDVCPIILENSSSA